jgi:hypothetical protein
MWVKSKAVDAKEGCYLSASPFAMLASALLARQQLLEEIDGARIV